MTTDPDGGLHDILIRRERILIDTLVEQRSDLDELIEDIQEQITSSNIKLQVLILEASDDASDDFLKTEPKVVLKTEETNLDENEDELIGHLELEESENLETEEEYNKPKKIKVAKSKSKVKKSKPTEGGPKYSYLKGRGLAPDGDHICDICGDVVTGIPNYRKHKRSHRDHVKRHTIVTKTCQHCCQELTLTGSKFLSHTKSCEAKNSKTNDFICNICGKGLPTSHTLKVHHRICSGAVDEWKKRTNYAPKPKKCPYEGCPYEASRESQVLSHINTVHLKKDNHTYVCNECGKAYTQPQHLRNHVKTVHRNIRPHVCQECGKAFFRASQLKAHMDIHLGVRSHQCPHCGKSFTHEATLYRHKQSCGKK